MVAHICSRKVMGRVADGHVRKLTTTDHQHGASIGMSTGQASQGFRYASGGRQQGGHGPSASPVIPIGHMHGALLLHDLNERNGMCGRLHRINNGPGTVTRNPGDVFHTMCFEQSCEGLAAGELHGELQSNLSESRHRVPVGCRWPAVGLEYWPWRHHTQFRSQSKSDAL